MASPPPVQARQCPSIWTMDQWEEDLPLETFLPGNKEKEDFSKATQTLAKIESLIKLVLFHWILISS